MVFSAQNMRSAFSCSKNKHCFRGARWLPLILILFPALAHADHVQDCAPSLWLDGDAELVQQLKKDLKNQHVNVGENSRCPGLAATINRHHDLISVQLADSEGHVEVREFVDIATVTVLLISRVKTDWLDGLENVPPTTEPRREPIPIKTSDSSKAPIDIDHSKTPTPNRFINLYFGPSLAYASDASSWGAAELSACIAMGPTCIGVSLRAEMDLGISGHAAQLGTSRNGFEILLSASYPFHLLSWFSLEPGLGLGLGWLRSRKQGKVDQPMDLQEMDSGGALVQPFVRSSFTTKWGLGLSPILYFSLSPMAHSGDFVDADGSIAAPPLWSGGVGLTLNYAAL